MAILKEGNILEGMFHRRLKKERGRNIKAFKIVLGRSKCLKVCGDPNSELNSSREQRAKTESKTAIKS